MMCCGVPCSFYWLKSAAIFLVVLGIGMCYSVGWSSPCHFSFYSPQILFLSKGKQQSLTQPFLVEGVNTCQIYRGIEVQLQQEGGFCIDGKIQRVLIMHIPGNN